MKIGIVCPYDLARGGGVQEHVIAQAQGLRILGHEVKILTPKVRRQTKSPAGVAEVIYIGSSAKVKTPIKTSLELGVSLIPDQVDEVLADENFDILHIHEPEVPLLGAQIVAKAQCPVVATFHAIHPQTPMGRTIKSFRIPYSRSIFSRLTALTAVSDPAAEFVRQRTGRPVQIIPNGIDLTKYRFKPRQTPAGQKTILYIGRLEKRKGVMHLLRAYRRLAASRTDVRLRLVGDGELRQSLEEYVKDHQLPRVEFLGYVSEKRKLELLHEACLFCSPALYGESFGIVLLEAMASGTVIVAGDNPGYSSVMQGIGQRSLVNPKQTIEFANRLSTMLDDQALRANWLNWAQTYVQQFDYPKIIKLYHELYIKTLKKIGRR